MTMVSPAIQALPYLVNDISTYMERAKNNPSDADHCYEQAASRAELCLRAVKTDKEFKDIVRKATKGGLVTTTSVPVEEDAIRRFLEVEEKILFAIGLNPVVVAWTMMTITMLADKEATIPSYDDVMKKIDDVIALAGSVKPDRSVGAQQTPAGPEKPKSKWGIIGKILGPAVGLVILAADVTDGFGMVPGATALGADKSIDIGAKLVIGG